jgi:hypothetical protein
VKKLFATKLRVASATFLSSFIVWLGLILLVAQPTDNIGRFQFSNFLILALFLGSAITASLSSMVIGLDFLGLEMKSNSLMKKFGRGQVTLQTRKSQPTMQLEKMQASRTKLKAVTHPLEQEKINLPDHPHFISDPQDISCPNCNKVFKTPLLLLDFREGKSRLVRQCPYCNFSLDSSKDKQTGEQTVRDSCQYWFGYLGQIGYGEAIPYGCVTCEKVIDCMLAKEAYSPEAVNEIKKWWR